jgi:DNA polymerase II small subunit/DNA polymerase delta subunit B
MAWTAKGPVSCQSQGEPVENFVPVFESKVKRLRDKIVKELAVPKKNRNKKRLKKMLDEIKGLKKTIKSAKKIKTCPHCGNSLWEEESL